MLNVAYLPLYEKFDKYLYELYFSCLCLIDSHTPVSSDLAQADI